MKVLITGSNGFIGSHLVERLLTQNCQVRCLVRKASVLKWIEHLPIELVHGDITDFSSLAPLISNVDYIYHLGGVLRTNKESEFFKVNCDGTKNLLEACRQQNPSLKRFIYVSSQAAAGPSNSGTPLTEADTPAPISMYGKSKLRAEEIVLDVQNIFPVTIIRPPAVYGPRDDDILGVFKYIKLGIKPLVGNQEKMVSIIYIADLVRGIHIAGEHPQAENEIFFISNRNGYSWIEIEDTIARVMKKKTLTIRLPEFVLDIMANLSEQMAGIFRNPAILNRDKAAEMKQNYWLIDSTKAESKLGFVSQISLGQGIEETYQWYRLQGWL